MEQPSLSPAPEETQTGIRQHALRTSLVHASKVTMAMAITMPLGLLTSMLLPRLLGNDKVGRLFFAETMPILFLSFVQLGLPAYISKTVPARPEHAREIFLPIVVFQSVFALLLLAGVYGFLKVGGYDPEVVGVTMIMSVYTILFNFCTDILQRLFIALGGSTTVAVSTVAAKVMRVGLIFAAVFAGGSLYWIAGASVLAQVVVTGGLVLKTRAAGIWGGLKTLNVKNLRVLKPVIVASFPFFAGSLLSTINGSIDSTMLSRFASYHEIGYFGVSQRLSGVFMLMVPVALNGVVPMLSRSFHRDPHDYFAHLQTLFRGLFVLSLPLALMLSVFGKEIMLWIYGPDFAPSTQIIIVNGPLLLVSYLTVFLAQHNIITTNGKAMTVVFAIGCLVNAVLDWALIPIGERALGLGGAGFGCMVATLVAELLTAWMLVKSGKEKAFDARTTYTFWMALAPLLVAVGFGQQIFSLPLLGRVAGFVILVPAYVFGTRMITGRDLVAAKKLIKSGRDARQAA